MTSIRKPTSLGKAHSAGSQLKLALALTSAIGALIAAPAYANEASADGSNSGGAYADAGTYANANRPQPLKKLGEKVKADVKEKVDEVRDDLREKKDEILADVRNAVINEIIVVARRRSERLVDVPLAITAFNTADLRRLGASDIGGIQGSVPNVNVVQGRGSSSSANFYIRGIGQPDALQTFDPAVGVYVDGVYMSRIQGGLLNLNDVDRVEVLRGPQGTLYGKNTIGGAVNVVTKKPNLIIPAGAGSLTYGAYNQFTAQLFLSKPMQRGKTAFSVAAAYDTRGGIVTDPRTAQKYNDRNNLVLRGMFRAKPSDTVEVLISGDYTKQKTKLTLGEPTAPLYQTDFVRGAVQLSPATPYGPWDRRASTSFTNGQGQNLTHWGLSGTVNIDLSDKLELTNILAYRKLTPKAYIDIDATQFQLGDVYVGFDQKQWSEELQLKYTSSSFKGVLGFYYLNEKIASHQEAYANDLFALNGAPITFTRFIDDKQNTDSFAVYGQGTYEFSPQFSMTGGLRYTKENKQYNRSTTTSSSLPSLNGISYNYPANLPAPYTGIDKVSFDAWTPMASLNYKPTKDAMIYVSASRGFKSGGFNGRVNSNGDISVTQAGVTTVYPYFKPEKVWTYEAGAKSSFDKGNVWISGAIFQSDYEDFQARVGNGTNIGLGGSFPVLNAGKLRIQGIEFEANVRPTKQLTLSAMTGYLHSEYKQFNDPRRVPPAAFSCNPTGSAVVCRPAFSPPLTMRVSADYRFDIGNKVWASLGGDMRYIDKQYLSVDNRPGLVNPGYGVGNIYGQLNFLAGILYVRGAVKNVTNTVYKTDGQEFSSVANIQTAYYGDPRTWELSIGFRF